jgi:hypothetical protein
MRQMVRELRPSHPRGSAEARAAFYRAKAAALRERAASAWDVTSATFIQAAETYEYMATSIEALVQGVWMSDETARFSRSLENRATAFREGTKDSADQSEAALTNSRALLKRFELRAAQNRYERKAASRCPPSLPGCD